MPELYEPGAGTRPHSLVPPARLPCPQRNRPGQVANWLLPCRYLTWKIVRSRASRVRWWYQAERAWWRRRQAKPVRGGAGRGRMGEQAGGLGDGERDHAGVGGRRLVRPDRGGCPGVGAVAEQGGGDGADGQGGHDQHGVPGDRGVEPDLGLIQPEAALPGPEILFHRPAAARRRGSAGSATPAGRRERSSSRRPARRWPGGGG